MDMHLPYDASGNASQNGMGRSFNPTNLQRYRSLIDDKINAGENARVLEGLARVYSGVSDGQRRPCWIKDAIFQSRD